MTSKLAAVIVVLVLIQSANAANLDFSPSVPKKGNPVVTAYETFTKSVQRKPTGGKALKLLAEQPIRPYAVFQKTNSVHIHTGPSKEITADSVNDCGPYVAATLLMTIGHTIDKPIYQAINNELNPNSKGTPVEDLDTFLNRYFRSRIRLHSTYPVLRAHLGKGLPAIAVIEPVPNSRHYVILTGYSTNRLDEIILWNLKDAGLSPPTLTHSKFLRQWECRDSGPNVRYTCLLIWPRKTPNIGIKPAPITASPDYEDPYRRNSYYGSFRQFVQSYTLNPRSSHPFLEPAEELADLSYRLVHSKPRFSEADQSKTLNYPITIDVPEADLRTSQQLQWDGLITPPSSRETDLTFTAADKAAIAERMAYLKSQLPTEHQVAAIKRHEGFRESAIGVLKAIGFWSILPVVLLLALPHLLALKTHQVSR